MLARIWISRYLLYLAGDLEGLPGCVLSLLGVSSGTAQGFLCLLSLVTGVGHLLADVGQSLHCLFSFCFSVSNLQVKL